jgi:NADPH:quinone reductase-like Zn-dependent oxidoreductase
MRAVVYTEHGGPDVLHVADVEEPHAGPGQVRVAVRAAGVNPVDWKARSGTFPGELPAIDGREAAGVVDEVGEGAGDVSAGDEVFGFTIGGGAAEYVLMKDFARKPARASWEEAAGLPWRWRRACACSRCSAGCPRGRRSSSTARPAASARPQCSWRTPAARG